jgi:hypothetical protein
LDDGQVSFCLASCAIWSPDGQCGGRSDDYSNKDSKGGKDRLFCILRHGGGGRRGRRFHTETHHHDRHRYHIGIILNFVALAYLCWLLFALAVGALPFFAGATAALAAYDSGSGLIAGIIVGVIAASIVVVLGRVALAWLHSPVTRAALALLFIVPAAVAGYHAARGLAYLFVSADAWRDAISIVGAAVVAATAGVRLAIYPPLHARRGLVTDVTSPDLPPSRTSEASARHL